MKKKKVKYQNILSIICILSSVFLIHSIYRFAQIETFVRYAIIGIIILFDLFILIKMFFFKTKRCLIYCIILFLFSILYLFLGYNLNRIYSYFTDLNKTITYSTSLVTLKTTKDIDLITLKNANIGIIDDPSSEDGYVLAQDIIKKESLAKNNNIIHKHSYTELILGLYDKDLDYIFLPSSYVEIFSTTEGLEDIESKVKTVLSTEMEKTKEEAKLLGDPKNIDEPFTMLLIGIDSSADGIKNANSFNGDSLMVLTFNPKTMTATMLSIPRDTYVPIACFPNKIENKITHSASRGTSCVINTIQNLLDIKIDYYMKINFTGLVELVDAVGGIDVDVPYSFCEQNSQRKFGNSTVYVKEGLQTLNGEQALALSRNRKNNHEYCSKEWTKSNRSDFIRAENQQKIVQGILNKVKSYTSISKIEDLLKIVSKNLDTNMKETTIFSFYNIAKDVMISSSSSDILSIQRLEIVGWGQTIYDETSKLQLWNYVPNKSSIEDVKDAIKINLGTKKHELIKTFNYSWKEEYTQKIPGKGPYKVYTTYDLLIDFTNKNITEVETWAEKNDITLKIEEVEKTGYKNGTVINQEYPVNKRLDLIPDRTLIVEVVKNKDARVDCLKDEENSVCLIPSFIGKTKKDVTTWGSKFSNLVDVKYVEVESEEKEDTIIEQSIVDITVKELLEDKKSITFTISKKKDVEPITPPIEEEDKDE